MLCDIVQTISIIYAILLIFGHMKYDHNNLEKEKSDCPDELKNVRKQ